MYVRTSMQAYSVYDREVGYCQGSPFIAGVLLLHVRGGREGERQVRRSEVVGWSRIGA